MTKLILNYVVFAAFLTASFVLNKTEDILTLQKNGKLELAIHGNDGSTHYLEPVKVNLTNTTRNILEVKIPAGLHFVSEDPRVQDIISTQSQIVKVAPNSNKEVKVSGVCIQHSNASPRGSSVFSLTGNAEKGLLELAEFLDKLNIENSQAQYAMWALSDGTDVSNIVGLDNAHEQELLDKTTSILGIPSVSIEQFKKWKQERVVPVYTSSLKGYFKFEFPRKTRVQIAIFNADHVLIKEIYNQEVASGFHKIDYQLEITEYEGQKIISQMIAYNKVVSKRSIDLRQR